MPGARPRLLLRQELTERTSVARALPTLLQPPAALQNLTREAAEASGCAAAAKPGGGPASGAGRAHTSSDTCRQSSPLREALACLRRYMRAGAHDGEVPSQAQSSPGHGRAHDPGQADAVRVPRRNLPGDPSELYLQFVTQP